MRFVTFVMICAALPWTAFELHTSWNKKTVEISEKELHENFAESYGIFSGKATQRTKLRFTPEKARWVSSETWHGQQVGAFDKEGNYLLEFDYNQDPELVMEILKH
jgi:hypothetical protein